MNTVEFSLRPMGNDDLGQVAVWMNDFRDVSIFDRCLPTPVGKENLAASWKPSLESGEPAQALWFVAETREATALGMCGLQGINYIHGDAVMPLFVTKEYRGKGLAKVMALSMIDIAFRQLRLNRVSTIYRADNAATRQIVTDLGFAEEGLVREGWFANGQYNDIVQVGLLKSEWDEKRPSVADRVAELPFLLVDNAGTASQ